MCWPEQVLRIAMETPTLFDFSYWKCRKTGELPLKHDDFTLKKLPFILQFEVRASDHLALPRCAVRRRSTPRGHATAANRGLLRNRTGHRCNFPQKCPTVFRLFVTIFRLFPTVFDCFRTVFDCSSTDSVLFFCRADGMDHSARQAEMLAAWQSRAVRSCIFMTKISSFQTCF